jgi:pimeloyl-ACP methyl ester carboxylesterase
MRMKPLFATPLILFVVWLALGTICPAHGQRGATVRESRIDVGGAELYAREVGTGPAIIVLHGGPDFDQSYLLPEMDRLSDSYRLIYYDQRGRGKSASNVRPEDVTLASDIADLEKVRQSFHLESATLLGHSWGTVIALEYALKYPERVSHLILMNPGPASREDYVQLRKDWLEKRPDAMAQRKAIAETAAYKEGDPEAVTAYYRIHFKPALTRPEDYEKLIARMRVSFNKEGVLMRGAESVEKMQEGNTGFERRGVRDQGQVHGFLDGIRAEHGPSGGAAEHHVGVVSENRQRVRGDGARRDVKRRWREFAGDLVHVGDHQEQSLRCGKRRGKRSSLEGAMHSASCASLALHLDDMGNASPCIGHGLRGPLVRPFAHRRRRGDGVNGDDFTYPISDMCDGLVAVHGLELALHEIPRSVISTGTTEGGPVIDQGCRKEGQGVGT